jgi:hypothetical protein
MYLPNKPSPYITQETFNSTIRVQIRIRPLSSPEIARNEYECINHMDSKLLMTVSPHKDLSQKNTQFEFHEIIPKTASQQEVYTKTARPLLPGLLTGLNTTIFAYGATGSGKTYTIQGNRDDPGIVGHIISDLFSMKEENKAKLITYKISYIEVYNENLRDLLTSVDKPVDIREDPQKGVFLIGANDILANNRKEIMTMIKIGNRNRMEESTTKNEYSSRSHSVLQILVESIDRTEGVNSNLHVGKLIISDLAGSEKCEVKRGGWQGHQKIEGANINRS